MAMTDEELLLQMNILASKTDANSNMAYKENATLNKGLDPDFFSGNATKIVNAINQLALSNQQTSELTQLVANKVNEILLDTSLDSNKAIWENTQELMEIGTLIQGIQRILQGKQQDKILGITPDDIGKILMVDQAEDGEMMVKAVEAVTNGGNVNAENIPYEKEVKGNSITNVKQAMDYIYDNAIFKGDISTGGGTADFVTWDMIVNPPEIPNGLELNEESLILKSENGNMSTVPLMSNEDVDDIIEGL